MLSAHTRTLYTKTICITVFRMLLFASSGLVSAVTHGSPDKGEASFNQCEIALSEFKKAWIEIGPASVGFSPRSLAQVAAASGVVSARRKLGRCGL
jgi:hypothetical protein